MTPELKLGLLIILFMVFFAFGSGVAVGLLIGLRKKDHLTTGHGSVSANLNT